MIQISKGTDKKCAVDGRTAPVVRRIFNEYADGRPMTGIIDGLTRQGIRSVRGNEFTVNSLRRILHNRSYIGEYSYAGVVIDGGMPALISNELFEKVQDRFARNKRQGPQRSNGMVDDGTPRYWLTGKLYCGECGDSMHGLSGTSSTGTIHYYYECVNHRHKKNRCLKHNIRKDHIEGLVVRILADLLSDSENLASLAVDVAAHYKQLYTDDSYLKSLGNEKKDVEKALNNLLKALEQGIFSETTQARLMELENQKKALTEAISAEEAKLSILQDDYSIRHYFELYAHADFTDTEVRDMVFEYFIDKIFVYEDRLVIVCWYSEDKFEVPFQEITDATSDDAFESSRWSSP